MSLWFTFVDIFEYSHPKFDMIIMSPTYILLEISKLQHSICTHACTYHAGFQPNKTLYNLQNNNNKNAMQN